MVEIDLSKTQVVSKEDLIKEIYNMENCRVLNVSKIPQPRLVVRLLPFIPPQRIIKRNSGNIMDAVDRREERSYSYRYRKSRFSNRNRSYRSR